MKSQTHRKLSVNPTRVISVAFVLIILVGTAFLNLPFASRNGRSCGILTALFTATSATCVTGLSLVDTYTQWSPFGQTVILCLIEIGGLGFMSAATVLIFLFRRRIGLRERMLMAQSLSVNDLEGIVRLQRTVLFGSLSVEFIGAAILSLRFLRSYPLSVAVKLGAFHSVSAFCNAGFDIFGFIEPGSSLVHLNDDPVVLLTLGALVIIGGLGALVWVDIVKRTPWKKRTVYTRLVMLCTAFLLVFGFAATCILEWGNPQTIGQMPPGQKLLNACFQSVTLRTAGFGAINQGMLTDSSKAVSVVLMLIGGSSGSTAGGLKTVTFMVLLLFMKSGVTGKSSVQIFKHTIPNKQVMDAITISVLMVFLAFFGGVFICATSAVPLVDAFYESVSAIATVGLSTGITASLSLPAKVLIIIYMYFGRVGLLTISMGFLFGNRAEERYRYAETNLLIG